MNTFIAILGILIINNTISNSYGAGSSPKKPSSSSPTEPSLGSTPLPYRSVQVLPVGTKVFRLLNNISVDLSLDLEVMLKTALNEMTAFQPTSQHLELSSSSNSSCQPKLRVGAVVSTLELGVQELQIRLGYNQGTVFQPGLSGQGEFTLKNGIIAVDFFLEQCSQGTCQQVQATTVTLPMVQTEVNFKIDFGLISSGGSFFHQTPLSDIFRKLFREGVKRLESQSRVHHLSWKDEVTEVDQDHGLVWIHSGLQQNVKVGDLFEVYEVFSSGDDSSCPLYRPLAKIRLDEVYTKTSLGSIVESYSSKTPKAGDAVFIHISSEKKL